MERGLESLLAAIAGEDGRLVASLLKENPGTATRPLGIDRQYTGPLIVHWIYAGDTPLHLASAGHLPEIVAELLARGAAPSAAGSRRRSHPIHYAADGYLQNPAFSPARQVETILRLLSGGGSVAAQEKNGATPLHRAVRTRCADAVECLLDAGADPVVRNASGSTPFHLAVQDTGRGGAGTDEAREAQRRIVSSFLARGVSPAEKDGGGRSVLEAARSESIRGMLGK